jgi:hypothetical protein
MKVEIDVPSKLSDITLNQYQAFMRVQDANDSDEFLAQKMVSIFCKIPMSQVMYINAVSVNDITTGLTKMFEGQKKLITKFKLGDKMFGFIPNLEDMSYGEYCDLEKYITSWDDMHKAMAVLYRPITSDGKTGYLIEDYEGSATYSDVMKYAPLDVVLGAVVFFYNLGNELLTATLNYIQVEAEQMTSAKSRNLVKDGERINQSINLAKAMLGDLKRLQSYPSFNA